MHTEHWTNNPGDIMESVYVQQLQTTVDQQVLERNQEDRLRTWSQPPTFKLDLTDDHVRFCGKVLLMGDPLYFLVTSLVHQYQQ